VQMCRLFWPMLKAAQGCVVNIGGGAARSPGADFSIGASVNAAMCNISKALSQLGKRDGVNVNVVHPGATETERFSQLLEQRSKASGKSVDQLKQEATDKDGLRRLGKPGTFPRSLCFTAPKRRVTSRGPLSRSMAAQQQGIIENSGERVLALVRRPLRAHPAGLRLLDQQHLPERTGKAVLG
jgi:NAD(P)-dependent dehydrogenase (short-subunit alcohol dehydrogenase family)